MNKTDLAIRPIYHRLFNRIEAHVCICFTAYTILLELERTLKKTEDKKNKTPGITIYRAKFLAESLYEIEYVNPTSTGDYTFPASSFKLLLLATDLRAGGFVQSQMLSCLAPDADAVVAWLPRVSCHCHQPHRRLKS